MNKRTKTGKLLLITMLLALFMSSLLAVAPESAATKYTDQTLSKDSHEVYSLYGGADDEFSIVVTVTMGAKIDVYIMRYTEYSNYSKGEDFTPVKIWENTSSVNEHWIMPDDSSYRLVVDNENNSRDSDAQPSGSVTYDIEERNLSLEDAIEELFGYGLVCVATCCGGAILVVVIVVYFLMRDRGGGGGRRKSYVSPFKPMTPRPPNQYQQPPAGPQQPPYGQQPQYGTPPPPPPPSMPPQQPYGQQPQYGGQQPSYGNEPFPPKQRPPQPPPY